jgi:hypothetical protein
MFILIFLCLDSILFEILHLFHDLAENFRTILRRIAILYQTDLNIKFQLVPNNLIIEPICE